MRSRRAATRVIGGIGAICIGLIYILTPDSEVRTKGFAWLPTILDADELAWIWIVAGAVAVVSAFVAGKWPRAQDIGFGALMLGPVSWAAIFAMSAIVGDNPRGLVTTTVYGVFVALYAIIAGWPDPPPRAGQAPAVPPDGGTDE